MEKGLSQDCLDEIQYWKNEIEKDPNDADNYSELANVYCDCGQYDKAITGYNNAISIDNENPYFYYNLALVLKEARRIDEAVAIFQDLVDLCPNEMIDLIESSKKEIQKITDKPDHSIEIIGIHEVNAPQPCHLVEIIIHKSNEAIDMSSFTQEIPGKPESSWQVPYNDMFLNSEGTEIIGDVMLDGDKIQFWTGDVRIAFFFHYLDLSKKLKTPFGNIELPEMTQRPERLKIMKYEPVD